MPVATVAIDGAQNAAITAARIFAHKYPDIDEALKVLTDRERERYDLTAEEALAGL